MKWKFVQGRFFPANLSLSLSFKSRERERERCRDFWSEWYSGNSFLSFKFINKLINSVIFTIIPFPFFPFSSSFLLSSQLQLIKIVSHPWLVRRIFYTEIYIRTRNRENALLSRISERKREKGNGVQNGRLESIAEGEGRERGVVAARIWRGTRESLSGAKGQSVRLLALRLEVYRRS